MAWRGVIAGGLNLYGYVGNNPISDRDPLGFAGCRASGISDRTLWVTAQATHPDDDAQNLLDYLEFGGADETADCRKKREKLKALYEKFKAIVEMRRNPSSDVDVRNQVAGYEAELGVDQYDDVTVSRRECTNIQNGAIARGYGGGLVSGILGAVGGAGAVAEHLGPVRQVTSTLGARAPIVGARAIITRAFALAPLAQVTSHVAVSLDCMADPTFH